MNISILGLGYVGSVTAACLADFGHHVIGVDRDKNKVDMIQEGYSPVVEKDLSELIKRNRSAGRLQATNDAEAAIFDTDVTLVCVGTPSNGNGGIDLQQIERVAHEIGHVLKEKIDYHLVVIRSTVLPGTITETIIPIMESASGKIAGKSFGIAVNPEFLREASAVQDFYNPPKTVIGSLNPMDGDRLVELYTKIDAPLIRTDIQIAEIIKYCDNSFHALKVTFANEIGLLCNALNVDSHRVMEIFCKDTVLNLSSAYLMPGFAFGGSCLPKDLKAITYFARHRDLELPVLNSILQSNNVMVEFALQKILEVNRPRIGFLGMAFKSGTDDLRNSPLITLIERLLGKGFDIRIYDLHVNLARLRGANKKFIEEKIPHISRLMKNNINEILDFADVLVIGNKSEEFAPIFPHLKPSQYVLDLVRINNDAPETRATYQGLSW
jgi:GDP-mannose 6-dehydrogenase